jgi:UDP-N-acetylglucosamine--N-acetylmuramyl-(pentapeptide) pyrophosphoryl-undecaprenol N-acetylglucosamine transferase
MKILLITSNTGGHIYPAIALAQQFKRREPGSQILFAAGEGTIGGKIIPKYGFDLKTIPTRRFKRRLSFELLLFPGILFLQIIYSFLILRSFGPKIIISTGGFMSLPLLLLAKLFKIPALILEQNVIPGLSNRLGLWLADKMVTSFEDSSKFIPAKTILLGTPLRESILSTPPVSSSSEFNLDPNRKTILILGGSQGARAINAIMPEAAAMLREGYSFQFLHAAGERDLLRVSELTKKLSLEHYHLLAYLDEIAPAMRSAQIIISRAGGSTLAEITALGIPAVLIPYPYAADNHQEFNARVLEKGGGAVVMPEDRLSAYALASIIEQLLENQSRLAQMRAAQLSMARPRAAEEIVNLAQSMIAERAVIR